jgi:hypothetical protein
MRRRGEEYWREAIRKHQASGMSAARFCRKHHLERGTFLRWRKKLEGSTLSEYKLVEVREGTRIGGGQADTHIDVRIGSDVRIRVRNGDDLALIASLIAAIQRVG